MLNDTCNERVPGKVTRFWLGLLCLQEEEEGSEEDSNTKPDFTVTLKTEFSAHCFLDQFEDGADGFISPMDDKMPSKCSQDSGLSNLHAASMYVVLVVVVVKYLGKIIFLNIILAFILTLADKTQVTHLGCVCVTKTVTF